MISTDIGIDLGTTNTIIYEKKKGIVLNEPSLIAIDKKTQKIIGIGKDAYQISGKEPRNIEVIWPMKNGIITDAEALELMLVEFIKKVKKTGLFIKPRILVSCPQNITTLEKEIIKEILLNIGARKVYIESTIKTAALGVGLQTALPSANMIVDIGGTTTDIGVISLNDIVKYNSVNIGGQKFNKDIIKYIREKYKVLIGEATAENIKIIYADVYNNNNHNKIEVKGKNLITGLPTTITVSQNELKYAIQDSIEVIINAITNVLEITPPELSADIVEKGIVITGGSSKIKGLLELLKEKTKVPMFIAEYPLNSTIEGTKILLSQLKRLQEDQ